MIGSSLPELVLSFMLLVSSGPQTISITLSLTKPATEKPSATVVSISVKNISSEPQSRREKRCFFRFFNSTHRRYEWLRSSTHKRG